MKTALLFYSLSMDLPCNKKWAPFLCLVPIVIKAESWRDVNLRECSLLPFFSSHNSPLKHKMQWNWCLFIIIGYHSVMLAYTLCYLCSFSSILLPPLALSLLLYSPFQKYWCKIVRTLDLRDIDAVFLGDDFFELGLKTLLSCMWLQRVRQVTQGA